MPNDDPNDSWHHPKSSAGKGWVKTWRKIYHPLGFKKGYNFPLFVGCVGVLMGFVLTRFRYLDFDGVFIKVRLSFGVYCASCHLAQWSSNLC